MAGKPYFYALRSTVCNRPGWLSRFLDLLKPYLLRLMLAGLCMIGVSAFTALMAYLIKPAMDDIFVRKDIRMLKVMPFVVLAVFFLKGLCQWASDYLLQHVGLSAVASLRRRLFHHILHMPLSFFDRESGGVLISRITNDVQEIQNAVSKAVTGIVRDVFMVLGLVFVIFYQNWRLALVAVAVLPVAFLPLFVFGRILRRLAMKGQQAMAQLTTVVHEAFRGIRIVKAFCREDHEKKRFDSRNDNYVRYARKSAWFDALSSPLMEFIGSIGIASIMAYGGYEVIMGRATPGSFFSFTGALLMLYKPVKSLSKVNSFIQRGIASLERVYAVLEGSDGVENTGRSRLKPIKKRVDGFVEFRNVTFGYGEEPVLKDLSFRVSPGEIVALVGPSGAGKTSLVNLIPRFYDVWEGSVLVDGVDVRDMDLEYLRRQVALVTQQSFLFNDTIRNNIAYGWPHPDTPPDEEAILTAVRLAYADEFIECLPEGLDTVVGEQGVRLSGGQQQRICIARAILKDAPILILDEATSSLDSQAELEVQKALDNLMRGRTTFIIAHRLSTVLRADRIFVVSEGRIVEEGSHTDLIERGGLYARLYRLQFSGLSDFSKSSSATQ
ncbi:lipid A export permease/ATP-binding protein MsbA [Thermodesulforhabdus norvegica]|uniref:ATP-binding cassette, subfamily B, MsbA n=1 Tax=Thermodesulforhabdus norvegica TaxID=39841 RepID=A0A1I4UQ27_9BACT|nr:lipid A export permease/ATP-binding protein MsbA [Thermodesulforhabdus norvegica]SFM90843.1 ATP-binding cassette, subfamily B, MsbA [Thermodesulforhabdus norvegica]